MQTGQNSIAPENSLPQLGQMRRDSVFMDLTIFPRQLKLHNDHRFEKRRGPGLPTLCRPPKQSKTSGRHPELAINQERHNRLLERQHRRQALLQCPIYSIPWYSVRCLPELPLLCCMSHVNRHRGAIGRLEPEGGQFFVLPRSCLPSASKGRFLRFGRLSWKGG